MLNFMKSCFIKLCFIFFILEKSILKFVIVIVRLLFWLYRVKLYGLSLNLFLEFVFIMYIIILNICFFLKKKIII